MRNYTYAVILWLLPQFCLAQVQWEGGLFMGGTGYGGDLNEHLLPEPNSVDLAYGLFVRRSFNPVWSVRAAINRGTWTGADVYGDKPFMLERDYSFENAMTSASILLEWDPFGKSRFPNGPHRLRPRITPYFVLGAGLAHFDLETDYNVDREGTVPEAVQEDRKKSATSFRPAFPVGGGLKIDFSRRTTIALEVLAPYSFTDYFDGVSSSGDDTWNDWPLQAGVNLTFRFGAQDSDGDGIVDSDDDCPLYAGSKAADGCPDQDNDGVEDAEDVCPNVPGPMEFSGCPDTDGDEIMDHADKCPFEYGHLETNGCPDRDNDCIADAEDDCPDTAAENGINGCPDTDKDGIADYLDSCPDGYGLAANDGCPLPDTDCDGILDRDDACPEIADTTGFSGCPENITTDTLTGKVTPTDLLVSKGITTPTDTTTATKAASGEVQIEAAEEEVLRRAQADVQFRTASSELLNASKSTLDEVVAILQKYPDYHVQIDGHTDSTGSRTTNNRLSKQRAESCYQYLQNAGISASRMQSAGYGEDQPIATNKTVQGRRLNRRVEFTLFVPER